MVVRQRVTAECWERVGAVARQLLSAGSMDALAGVLEREVSALAEAARISIYLREEESGRLRLMRAVGFDDREWPDVEREADSGCLGWVIRNRAVLDVTDVGEELPPSFSVGRSDARAVLYYPIVHNARVVGCVGLESADPAAFDEGQKLALSFIVELASASYARLALLAESERQVKDLQEQRRQQAAFRALTDNAVCAVALADLKGRLVYGNRAVYELFGYDFEAQEMSGRPLVEFWPDDDVPLLMEVVLPQALEGGWHGKVRQKRKDGSIFHADLMVFPVQDDEENTAFLAAIITEREETRKMSPASSALFGAMLDSIPMPVFVTDREGRYLFVNRAFAEFEGVSPEDVLGKTVYECRPGEESLMYHQDDQALMKADGRRVYEFQVTDSAGVEHYGVFTKACYHNADGSVAGLVGTLLDITERRRLEEQVRDLLHRRIYQVQTAVGIAQEITTAATMGELFERVVTLVKERFGYYHVQLFRYEPAMNAMVLAFGYGEAGQRMMAGGYKLELGRGVVGQAAAIGEAVLVADVSEYPEWVPLRYLPESRGELAVPIKWRDQVLGVLDVHSNVANVLSEDDLILLEDLCGQIAIVMENARLREEMEESLGELERLTRAMIREGWETFRGAEELPGGYLFDLLDVRRADDLWMPEIRQAVSRRSMVRSDAGVAVTPMQVRGEVVGVVGVYDDPEQPLSPDDLSLIETVSEQVALALESARLLRQTQAALAEVEATHRRYLREAWESFLISRGEELSGYLAGPDGIKPLEEVVLPEMAEALERGEPVSFEDDGDGARRTALAVPLRIRGQTIGVVDFYREGSDREWTEEELSLVQALVAQVADSIEGERLFAQTQASLAEAERLYQASRRISTARSRQEIIGVVLDVIASTAAELAMVFMFEKPSEGDVPEWQELVAFWSRDGGESPMPLYKRYMAAGHSLSSLLSANEPLVIPDVLDDERVDAGVREMLRAENVRAMAFVPLSVGDEWLGHVVVMLHSSHEFTPDELRVYRAVSDQAAVALRSLRLLQEAESRARRERLIREITSKIRGSVDLESILNTAVRELGQALGVSRVFVKLSTRPDEGPRELEAGGDASGEPVGQG